MCLAISMIPAQMHTDSPSKVVIPPIALNSTSPKPAPQPLSPAYRALGSPRRASQSFVVSTKDITNTNTTPNPRLSAPVSKTESVQFYLGVIAGFLRNSYAMCLDEAKLDVFNCAQFKELTKKAIKAIQNVVNDFISDEGQKRLIFASSCKYLEASVALVTAIREYKLCVKALHRKEREILAQKEKKEKEREKKKKAEKEQDERDKAKKKEETDNGTAAEEKKRKEKRAQVLPLRLEWIEAFKNLAETMRALTSDTSAFA